MHREGCQADQPHPDTFDGQPGPSYHYQTESNDNDTVVGFSYSFIVR